MLLTIQLGKHRPRPKRFGVYFNRKSFKYRVKFLNSCVYTLPEDDINKLFGFGYFSWKLFLGKTPHHIDSARVGWRYNGLSQKIELFLYCYVNGYRRIEHIYNLGINTYYDIELIQHPNRYVLSVIDSTGGLYGRPVYYSHNKKLQYLLWGYFGGNEPAPHEMSYELTKL
jgi:hypothetical protein